ncbi:hypothetical protein [Dyadobacter sp. CY312]|nr:hypothetical protein [Dyadobacter sp. CY312]MCE7039346.1 hypothetical protein [Dyadobacter sp. CY312]
MTRKIQKSDQGTVLVVSDLHWNLGKSNKKKIGKEFMDLKTSSHGSNS